MSTYAEAVVAAQIRLRPVADPPTAKAEKLADEKTGAALIRFRLVAEALGKNADELLEEFAQAWLEALAEKLNDEEA